MTPTGLLITYLLCFIYYTEIKGFLLTPTYTQFIFYYLALNKEVIEKSKRIESLIKFNFTFCLGIN